MASSAPPYQTIVSLLQNGQSVDAPTTNVPITQLAGRTDALLAMLEGLQAGAANLAVGVTLDANLPIGSPVYLGADGVFHLALTALANDAAGGVLAASSFVRGIVFSLDGPTSGTVALNGRVSGISTAQWATVIDTGTFSAGSFWLSATTAGLISLTPGPLQIYICQLMADGTAYLGISPPDYGAHTHNHFVLSGNPAGTVVDPSTGQPQTVNTPNTALVGWLPAEAPYIDPSQVPAGASFVYNLTPTAAAALKAALPPIPNDGTLATQGGIAIPNSQLVCNDYGIFWVGGNGVNSATYGNAPWPVDYNATSVSKPIDFFFVQLAAATDDAIVTSLGVAPNTVIPLAFVDASGAPASGGKLFLSLPSLLTFTSTTDDSATAVKSITGGDATSGPVVGHLIQGPGVTLTSENTDGTGAYGDVTISASSAQALQGNAILAQANNANQQFPQAVQMVVLPQARASAPVWTFSISPLAPLTSTLTLSLWLYSSISGTLPSGFTIAYRIVPAPTSLTTLPTGWTSLGWTATSVAVGAGQSQVITISPTIPSVPTGAIVLIQITRANSDGFAGDIGIIRLGYSLS